MAPSDPSWNFQDPASKERVLSVLQGEMDAMFDLVADPARWKARTACESWEARDVVGHLVDTTEGYLPAFARARSNASADAPLGLRDMAIHVDQGAKSLRKVPREELIGRLRDDSERMMGEFASLSAEDWTGFMVPHKYMGPLPAMFYPTATSTTARPSSSSIRRRSCSPGTPA
jgi:Mycothiol maleylpyruvate isomerase N-terminal domain